MSARPVASWPESSDPFNTTHKMNSPNTPAVIRNNEIGQTHVFTSRDPSIEKKTRTIADLRAARESRANEALKMKDEQLRILQDQNNQLLGNLDRIEEEATRIQQERLTVEEENRTLRETVFESQGRAQVAEAALKKVQVEEADREKQLRIMTDQNAELLRLLEQEEAQAARLGAANESALKELEALRAKYASLLTTAKSHEEMAGRAARDGQLRAEEVRLLRAEAEQIKNQNSELKMKTQVELESLQEQLRVRKEKQYQLLEKLQGQEEAKRQAEDQVSGMEDRLRALHTKSMELETQLQVEARGKRSAEEANRDLVTDAENARQSLRELQGKVGRSESERMRMEIEARDSGEQLREMAEKVFQLLERLKLAELAKNKTIEALRHKDQEVVALKQKNSRLVKESTKEGKSRVKVELDLKVSQDQVAALKKHNAQLACRCREEAKAKIKEHDERVETQEKVRTLGGRLSFLLNKMQSDEESRVLLKEEAKKTEAQVKSLTVRAEELQRKLEEAGESNRMITQAVRLKQDEVDKLSIANEAISRRLKEKDPTAAMLGEERPEVETNGSNNDGSGGGGGGGGGGGDGIDARDIDSVRATGGKGVFYVESRPAQGLLLLKGKRPRDRDWLDDREVNAFLKRAQKTPRFKELAVEKFCQLYGLLLVEEEDRKSKEAKLSGRTEQLELMCRKNAYLQDKVATEEEAKRRTLLRYIHAVKAASSPSPVGSDEHHQPQRATAAAVGKPGRGILQLPESGVTDEEAHAIAALLRGNSTIAELNLRGNEITDDGAAAIGAVLAGRMGLRLVDLRGNRISKQGIRTIAESLERSERVRHVYVHAGGKVEALGTGVWAAPRGRSGASGAPATAPEVAGSDKVPPDPEPSDRRSSANPPDRGGGTTTAPLVTVETVCVVDLRENTPPENGNRGVFSVGGSASFAIAMDDPAAPLPPGWAVDSSSSLLLSSSSVGGTRGGRGRAAAAAKAPVFATSVLPGELCARGSPVSRLGVGVRGSRGRGGDKAAAKFKRYASEQRRAEKREREREERRNRQMELGWTGRNGGLDTRPTSNCSSIGSGGAGSGGGGQAKAGGGGGGNLPRVGTTTRGCRQGQQGHRPSRGQRREGESEDECLVGTPKTRIARTDA